MIPPTIEDENPKRVKAAAFIRAKELLNAGNTF
jgi:hypothetical protein